MNIELFVAVLAVLVVYRILLPLIDTINPLAFLTTSKKISAVARNGQSESAAGIGHVK